MVARVTGDRALPAEVMKQIVAKTDGNPLFIEELTKAVLEAGILKSRTPTAIGSTGHCRRSPSRQPFKSFDVAARPPSAGEGDWPNRRSHGRNFSYSLLCAVAGRNETVLKHALAQLEQAELVSAVASRQKPSTASSTPWCGMRPREPAEEPPQQLQARLRTLEERFADIVASQPEIVAHHFTEAGLMEPAIDDWLRLDSTQPDARPNAEALNHLACGSELVPNIDDPMLRSKSELLLQTSLGHSLRRLRAGALTV